MDEIMLTDRQRRFVLEYCKDFVGVNAYIRAGYSEKGAATGSSTLLNKPEVKEAIEERKEELAAVAALTPEWVLHQWLQIASANPNDIVRIEVTSCAGCYDPDTRALLIEAGLRDTLKTPNPDCTTCGGHGFQEVRVTDTRKLSGAARRLYAGAQRTKDGIKVLMRDQDAALQNISRYLGMVVDKKEISGPGGGPVPLATMDLNSLSDAQLEAIIASGNGQNEIDGGIGGGTHQLGAGNAVILDAL